MKPALADLDAASAVIFEIFTARVSAPQKHRLPCLIFSRFFSFARFPVCSAMTAIIFPMTTRLRVPITQLLSLHNCLFAAVAPAYPMPFPISLFGWFKCNQLAKALACYIYHFGHRGLHARLRVKWRVGVERAGPLRACSLTAAQKEAHNDSLHS